MASGSTSCSDGIEEMILVDVWCPCLLLVDLVFLAHAHKSSVLARARGDDVGWCGEARAPCRRWHKRQRDAEEEVVA
ncbi:hypothetical protein GmHk_09G026870 [Glycine max]|nr:hypothetical protein JHK87_025897 [Glycine soja]KAH1044401.1 hypothetical protein GYH30_025928 [Glycine max]KAH1234748.1 hypothetical protein GmHk_09G026870 [Glycine max]